MNIGYKDRESLLKDIERYFECELTEDEEKELRIHLLNTKWECKEIEEARAVMGYGIINNHFQDSVDLYNSGHNRLTSVGRGKFIRIGMSIASMFLLVVTIACVIRLIGINISNGDCIAYSNGNMITDEDQVLEILQQQFAELESGVNEANHESLSIMGELGSFLNETPK